MTSAPFEHRLVVRYHEADAQGHVFHARYLEYLDVAMTEWLRSLTRVSYTDLVTRGCDLVLARTALEFRAPARFDDELAVGVRVLRVGGSSLTLAFSVDRVADRGRVLDAETVYVNYDPAGAKARPLPQFVRELLTAS